MSDAGQAIDTTYLTVVSWPPDASREEIALILAARDLDEATVRMRLGQPPPMVVGPTSAATARDRAKTLRELGGDAFTFTLDHLAALGAALVIKDMKVVENALSLELWNGMRTTLPTASIQILVRAQLSKTITERRARPRLSSTARRVRTPDSIRAEIESATTRRVKTSDRLDIHTTDGTVYQVNGDRFGFRVLGNLRGHADKVNTDRVCELLHHLAPEAVVDTYYKLWKPPPGYRRLRIRGDRPMTQDISFVFYSRWTALTYRHVMG